MIDIVFILTLMIYSVVAYIGITAGVITFSIAVRGLLFLFPVFCYRKRRTATLCAIGCNIAIVGFRALALLYLKETRFLTDEFFSSAVIDSINSICGLLDLIIVTIYYVLISIVTYNETKHELSLITEISQMSTKNKIITTNFIQVNFYAVLTYCITGIWSYYWKKPVTYLLVFYCIGMSIINYYFLKLINTEYSNTVKRVIKDKEVGEEDAGSN